MVLFQSLPTLLLIPKASCGDGIKWRELDVNVCFCGVVSGGGYFGSLEVVTTATYVLGRCI